jgi:hypothetical protein
VAAPIYLANILYERGDDDASLYHFERTRPEDHWDELGIWRLVELKRAAHKLDEHDPELKPWEDRLAELGGEVDDIDELFLEVDGALAADGDVEVARGQLELFGGLLSSLVGDKSVQEQVSDETVGETHTVLTPEGQHLTGSWEEIVRSLRDRDVEALQDRSMSEFMARVAKRTFRETGVRVPHHDAELFLRASADAGLLRIVR